MYNNIFVIIMANSLLQYNFLQNIDLHVSIRIHFFVVHIYVHVSLGKGFV